MWKAALAAGVTALSAVAAAAQVNPADLKWGPGPASLPRGATMALLSGDPGKSGVFVIRLNMPAGYKIPAHHHPTDEYVTVISGDALIFAGVLGSSPSRDADDGVSRRKFSQLRPGNGSACNWAASDDCAETGAAALVVDAG